MGDDRSKQVYFLFCGAVFSKEIANMFTSCFYRVIETLVKVWENSKKLWKHLPAACVPQRFSFSQTFTLVS